MNKLESFLYYGSIVQPEQRGEGSKKEQNNIARSSNGRTAVSGTAYRGSSPCRAALSINHSFWE